MQKSVGTYAQTEMARFNVSVNVPGAMYVFGFTALSREQGDLQHQKREAMQGVADLHRTPTLLND